MIDAARSGFQGGTERSKNKPERGQGSHEGVGKNGAATERTNDVPGLGSGEEGGGCSSVDLSALRQWRQRSPTAVCEAQDALMLRFLGDAHLLALQMQARTMRGKGDDKGGRWKVDEVPWQGCEIESEYRGGGDGRRDAEGKENSKGGLAGGAGIRRGRGVSGNDPLNSAGRGRTRAQEGERSKQAPVDAARCKAENGSAGRTLRASSSKDGSEQSVEVDDKRHGTAGGAPSYSWSTLGKSFDMSALAGRGLSSVAMAQFLSTRAGKGKSRKRGSRSHRNSSVNSSQGSSARQMSTSQDGVAEEADRRGRRAAPLFGGSPLRGRGKLSGLDAKGGAAMRRRSMSGPEGGAATRDTQDSQRAVTGGAGVGASKVREVSGEGGDVSAVSRAPSQQSSWSSALARLQQSEATVYPHASSTEESDQQQQQQHAEQKQHKQQQEQQERVDQGTGKSAVVVDQGNEGEEGNAVTGSFLCHAPLGVSSGRSCGQGERKSLERLGSRLSSAAAIEQLGASLMEVGIVRGKEAEGKDKAEDVGSTDRDSGDSMGATEWQGGEQSKGQGQMDKLKKLAGEEEREHGEVSRAELGVDGAGTSQLDSSKENVSAQAPASTTGNKHTGGSGSKGGTGTYPSSSMPGSASSPSRAISRALQQGVQLSLEAPQKAWQHIRGKLSPRHRKSAPRSSSHGFVVPPSQSFSAATAANGWRGGPGLGAVPRSVSAVEAGKKVSGVVDTVVADAHGDTAGIIHYPASSLPSRNLAPAVSGYSSGVLSRRGLSPARVNRLVARGQETNEVHTPVKIVPVTAPAPSPTAAAAAAAVSVAVSPGSQPAIAPRIVIISAGAACHRQKSQSGSARQFSARKLFSSPLEDELGTGAPATVPPTVPPTVRPSGMLNPQMFSTDDSTCVPAVAPASSSSDAPTVTASALRSRSIGAIDPSRKVPTAPVHGHGYLDSAAAGSTGSQTSSTGAGKPWSATSAAHAASMKVRMVAGKVASGGASMRPRWVTPPRRSKASMSPILKK